MEDKKWSDINSTLELRFNAQKDFFIKQNVMISNFISIFPQYNSQGINNIMMHTEDFPGISFSLSANRFGMTFEKEYELNKITEYINKAYSIINNNMHIKKFDRIGFRVRSVKYVSIEEAKQKINSYINISKINREFSLDASDITVILHYNEYKIKASYRAVIGQGRVISSQQIGPINVKINAQNFPIDNSVHGIAADVDFHKINVEDLNVNEFIKKAYEGIIKCKNLMD